MTGTAVKNLDLFTRLCGDESLKNVMLLTTKWDTPAKFSQSHEEELTTNFWASMIKLGCPKPKRIGAIVDEASSIVDPISQVIAPMLKYEPTWLQIQRELGTGKDLIGTLDGQYLNEELSAAVSEYMQIAKSVLQEAHASKQKTTKEMLTEEAEEYEAKLEDAQKDKEALAEDFGKVMQAEAERRSKLFGFGVLDRLDNYAFERIGDSTFRAMTVGFASAGLLEACKYIWKKQGVDKKLIQSAEDYLVML